MATVLTPHLPQTSPSPVKNERSWRNKSKKGLFLFLLVLVALLVGIGIFLVLRQPTSSSTPEPTFVPTVLSSGNVGRDRDTEAVPVLPKASSTPLATSTPSGIASSGTLQLSKLKVNGVKDCLPAFGDAQYEKAYGGTSQSGLLKSWDNYTFTFKGGEEEEPLKLKGDEMFTLFRVKPTDSWKDMMFVDFLEFDGVLVPKLVTLADLVEAEIFFEGLWFDYNSLYPRVGLACKVP